jgi:DNA-binding transcriptional ArsR family regulator
MSPSSAPAVARDAAPLFAALGDETRLGILLRLSKEGPASIATLGADAHVTRQAVTKHLDVLESAGLVTGRRDGRERIFEVERRRLARAGQYLERISRQWDDALERLRAHVEE